MKATGNSHRLQFRIGLIALTVVTLHVTLGLYVVFTPDHSLIRAKVVKIYKQLIVLGPFFTESRIKSSHSLSIRYKRNNNWSPPREFGKEHFLFYCRNPWRCDKLPYSEYEKRLSDRVGKLAKAKTFERVKNNSSFRELNGFMLQEFIKAPVDSISMVYALNHYNPKKGSYKLDTIFIYTYNPTTIGKAKK